MNEIVLSELKTILELQASNIGELYMRVSQLEATPTVLAGGGGGAPVNAFYFVGQADATLTNEIVLTYAQGSVIRGGAADWEVHNANTNHFILVGDGTDITSKAFDWDDMSAGAGADMVHDHSAAAEGGGLVVGTTDTDATAGSVFFAGVGGVLQEDNSNLFWNDGTDSLAVGHNSPLALLEGHSSRNALTDLSDPTNYHSVFANPADDTNEGVGIGWYIDSGIDDIGAAVVFVRTDIRTKGELRFYTKQTVADATAPTLVLTMQDDGQSNFWNNIILDDGVGNSPSLQFVGGTNDDTITLNLIDTAVAGRSDLRVTLADAAGRSILEIRDSTNAQVLAFDSDGNVRMIDGAQHGVAGGILLTFDDTAGALVLSGGVFDLNGIADVLVLDADGDTTISAPTDDQIDIEISGADDFTFTANAFNVLSGSNIVMADDAWIGLGAAAGRIVFDDQATDAIYFLDSNVFIGAFIASTNFTVSEDNADTTLPVLLNQEGAGDTGIRFRLGGSSENYSIGIDNSDSDRFKLTHSTGLSADDVWWVSTTGTFKAETAVLREGWFCGYAAEQTAFDGTLTDIDIDTEIREDTDFYTHAAGSDDITITDTGWYRISYCINVRSEQNDRQCVRIWVYDDGVAIPHSLSQCYVRFNTYGRYVSCSNSFIVEISASSVIDLRTDGQFTVGAFGAGTCDYDILSGSQITIEKVDE